MTNLYDTNDFMIQASGMYLTNNFPDNWSELEEDELDLFMEEYVWQPFEYWPTDEVFDLIEAAAVQFALVANEVATKTFTECKESLHQLSN